MHFWGIGFVTVIQIKQRVRTINTIRIFDTTNGEVKIHVIIRECLADFDVNHPTQRRPDNGGNPNASPIRIQSFNYQTTNRRKILLKRGFSTTSSWIRKRENPSRGFGWKHCIDILGNGWWGTILTGCASWDRMAEWCCRRRRAEGAGDNFEWDGTSICTAILPGGERIKRGLSNCI